MVYVYYFGSMFSYYNLVGSLLVGRGVACIVSMLKLHIV